MVTAASHGTGTNTLHACHCHWPVSLRVTVTLESVMEEAQVLWGEKEEALFRPLDNTLQPALDQMGLWVFARLLPDVGLSSVCLYATHGCGTRASGHQDPSTALEGPCGLFCLTLHILRGNPRFLPQTWLTGSHSLTQASPTGNTSWIFFSFSLSKGHSPKPFSLH